MPDDNRTRNIAKLNDECRRNPSGNCQILITQGIRNLPQEDIEAIIQKMRSFNDFTPDNDPYSEHDFGAFEHNGHKIFWKIDYYDPTLQYGSEDPADPEKTKRVLTIMLAEEY